MNGEYNVNLLDRFNDDLKKTIPYLAKKVFFYQENAKVNKTVVTLVKFKESPSS